MPLDPTIWNPSLTGPAGADGKTIHTVSGAPSDLIGVDYDYAIDPVAWVIYGPKIGGVWPAGSPLVGPAGTNGTNGVPGARGLKGDPGTAGAAGTPGSVIHSGLTAPAVETGINGDYFINLVTSQFYGPKTAGSWGVPITLQGIQGVPGQDGSQIYADVNAPLDSEGLPGDYWWDTFSYTLWGPKDADTGWTGTDVVLKGVQGDPGPAGAAGADAPIALSHYGQQNVTNNTTTLFVPAAADATLATNTDYVQVVGIFQALPHGENNGITQQTNQLTVARSGKYLVHIWATLSASVNNPNVAFKFAVNGGIALARRPWVKLGNAGDKSNISAHGFVSLAAGDIVTLYVASTLATNLTINDLVFSLSEMIATGKTGPVQDEGVEVLSNPEAINFVGDGVTVTEDPSGVVKVTIPGGSGGPVTSADYVGFNLLAGHSVAEGEIAWNATDKTLDVGLADGVVGQAFQEQYLRAYNDTGSTILNGKAVYISGSSGGFPTVALADASSASAHKTLAVATHDVTDVTNGYFTTYGKVRDLDTSAWAPGTELWLASGSPGGLTGTKPSAPNHAVRLGYVIVQDATAGEIFVTVADEPDFTELTDVNWSGASAGDVPIWDGTSLVPGDVVKTVVDGAGITVDATDPQNPVVAWDGVVVSDEGTPVVTSGEINFTGAGVTVTDVGGVATVDIPGGGGGGSGGGYFSGLTNTGVTNTVSTGAFATKGGCYFKPDVDITVTHVNAIIDQASTGDNYYFQIVEMTGVALTGVDVTTAGTVAAIVGSTVSGSTGATVSRRARRAFAVPVVLEAGKYYVIVAVFDQGSGTAVCRVGLCSTSSDQGDVSINAPGEDYVGFLSFDTVGLSVSQAPNTLTGNFSPMIWIEGTIN